MGRADIDLAQSLLRRLLVGRAAGTAGRFTAGENRDRGFVFKFLEEIAGDGLEQPAFDGALASASSSQSLEKSASRPPLMVEPTMLVEGRTIFV
jgi:hypothetical protein